jgi:hypothetical protein
MSKSHATSDQELLELYAEEWFIDEHYLVEDDTDPQQHTAATALDVPPSSDSTTGQWDYSQPVSIPVPVHNEQQACPLYPAQLTTLLFDIAEPTGFHDELVLYSTFCREAVSVPLKRPGTQDWEYPPAHDVYEYSLMILQSTRAFDLCCDTNTRMLDYDYNIGDQVQEAAFEYTFTHRGRSLTHPSTVCSDTKLDEQANLREREDTFFLGDDEVCNPRVDYERVLRQITRNNFLPSVEHISNVEARSASLTYDDDIQELQQATAEFLADSCECSFLGNKVSAAALPGENFFLADNNSDVGLSVQHPTANSLLSLVDEVVDGEPLVEELTHSSSLQYQQPAHSIHTSPVTFFDNSSSRFIGYTALDQLLSSSPNVSYVICAQFDAADDVSDTSDKINELTMVQATNVSEEVNESPMVLPSEPFYFDAGIQQSVAYTAFNQLLVDFDNEETLSRTTAQSTISI